MTLTDTLWKVFESTGNIGAYMLYKDYQKVAATCEQDLTQGELSTESYEGIASTLEYF